MADFVQCPACDGLLDPRRAQCPHCDLSFSRKRPGQSLAMAFGLSLVVATHVVACECYGLPIHCTLPDGGSCTFPGDHPGDESQDAGPAFDAGSPDGGEDAGLGDGGSIPV